MKKFTTKMMNLHMKKKKHDTNKGKSDGKKTKQKKYNISFKSCFVYLMRSSYLCFIVILVVSYNIVYNLSDVLFTHQAKTNFTDINHVNVYMNQITFFTGVLAVLSALFLSGNIIRRYGWTVTAIITPIVWFISSLFLFSLLFYEDMVE